MKRTFDFNRCTKEQLVRFHELYHKPNSSGPLSEITRDIEATAEVKLRTRAEVDADIAKVIREYYKDCKRIEPGPNWDSMSMYKTELDTLCTEETQG